MDGKKDEAMVLLAREGKGEGPGQGDGQKRDLVVGERG